MVALMLLEIEDVCFAHIDNILSSTPVAAKGVACGHGYEEVIKPSILLISLSHKISYTPITILSICGNN